VASDFLSRDGERNPKEGAGLYRETQRVQARNTLKESKSAGEETPEFASFQEKVEKNVHEGRPEMVNARWAQTNPMGLVRLGRKTLKRMPTP
jgi:hypothetical protein